VETRKITVVVKKRSWRENYIGKIIGMRLIFKKRYVKNENIINNKNKKNAIS